MNNILMPYGKYQTAIKNSIFLLLVVVAATVQAQTHAVKTGKIPIYTKYWYELNNGGTKDAGQGLAQLTDGITNAQVTMGYGKVVPVDMCVYNFKEYATNVTITGLDLYSFQGGNTPATPWNLYAKADDNAPLVLLASFIGNQYMTNIHYKLNNVKAKYLVIKSSNGVSPSEMTLTGSYLTAPPITYYPAKPVTFGHMLGTNSFEWDVEDNGGKITVINAKRFNAIQFATQIRHYMDWDKLEHIKGQYTFSPTRMGKWDYDMLYQNYKAAGITVLADLKTQPDWMLATYPSNSRIDENVPVTYGSDFALPASYIDQGKVAFQFAARYGKTKVNADLLSIDTYSGNTAKTGLNLINYIESDNERDKSWKGRSAYQTAYEYAANLSAFYDGDKDKLGKNVGVKNADPTMQVVVAGTAGTTTDYFRGIIDWSIVNRGYKADGTVNLPFDVINVHCYNFNPVKGANQPPVVAPELAGLNAQFAPLIKLGLQYNKEVWVTETGYDDLSNSPLGVPTIGNKSAELVKADWILRTALAYPRLGVNRVFFYQTYNNGKDASMFETSGLLDGSKPNGRKPSADYLYQAKQLLGNYTFRSTKTDHGVIVDTYTDAGKTIKVLVSPTMTGKSVNYTLDAKGFSKAQLLTPKVSALAMKSVNENISNDSLRVVVTETPVFVALQ
jgi:endoglucanase